ncbi:MAG TPA: Crp/Fnr family transcriptional regulator [Bacteroidia bacterium]|nr:Crp/Fnr family transcriptional regulator [Bacteroidia bacterium]
MFEALIENIKQQAAIEDAGIEKFISALKIRHIKKKKNLLSEGDPANMMFYVNKGLFRYYVYTENGVEHTTDLIAQNNWFGDAKAFLLGQQAGINIEALEDSTVFILSYEDLHRFYDEIPMFERAVRKITEHYFIKALDRSKKVNRAGYSAQERYMHYVNTHPKLANRVPAIYLASYLGITPETFSRLRSQFLKQTI